MAAWLSSFHMIPMSLVYSFSGMNDSFVNGVGVPSVKCQISISAGIGGQYIPQYNIFCYISCLITEAWLSSFPMIPISLVYRFSGMNDSFLNGCIGGQYLPQYHISADNVTRCTAQSSVPSSHLSSQNFKSFFVCSDIDDNDHDYHDPYRDMSRLSPIVDKARVIGQIQAGYTNKWMAEFVSSRPGERFAWPACSPGMNPIGQL